MIKNNNFLLLILFSLFILKSNDLEHESCKHKQSLFERVMKIALVSFAAAHLHPFLNNLLTSPTFIQNTKQFLNMHLTTNDKKALAQKTHVKTLKIIYDELKYSKDHFMYQSKQTHIYFLAIGFGQALAEYTWKITP